MGHFSTNYKKIFKELEEAKINYLIVGGVAVNLYGYTRFTGDIDILLALNPANLIKMDKLMHKLDYVERIPVNIKEPGNKVKLNEFIKKKGLKAYIYISNSQPQLDIDIIVKESSNFKNHDKEKTIIKVWDMKLPVASIDNLIKMKKSAKRDKYSKPENKLKWLYSALVFGKTKKIVLDKKTS